MKLGLPGFRDSGVLGVGLALRDDTENKRNHADDGNAVDSKHWHFAQVLPMPS